MYVRLMVHLVESHAPAFRALSPAMARRSAQSPLPIPTHHDRVAHRLKLTRLASGFRNQAEFCRRVGITQQAWNNYERGVNRISLDQAFKLVNALGVDLDWIYRGATRDVPRDMWTRLQPLLSPDDLSAAS
jgi:DNA-binding XRE family transcriptional regulator